MYSTRNVAIFWLARTGRQSLKLAGTGTGTGTGCTKIHKSSQEIETVWRVSEMSGECESDRSQVVMCGGGSLAINL